MLTFRFLSVITALQIRLYYIGLFFSKNLDFDIMATNDKNAERQNSKNRAGEGIELGLVLGMGGYFTWGSFR